MGTFRGVQVLGLADSRSRAHQGPEYGVREEVIVDHEEALVALGSAHCNIPSLDIVGAGILGTEPRCNVHGVLLSRCQFFSAISALWENGPVQHHGSTALAFQEVYGVA